jgi:hypothetical protein
MCGDLRVVLYMTTSRITLVPLLLAVVAALALLVGAASAAVSTPSAAPSGGTLLTWHGAEQEVQLPAGQDMIPGAPSSFRRFARAELRGTWIHYLHKKPACEKAPTFYVRALRTDGFAFGDAGTYPRPGCATGGGYEAFWAIRHGVWKQVIGTQDVPTCQRLEKLGFPSELGIDQCYDGHDVVAYSHP